MGIYVEAIILYIILFFSGSAGSLSYRASAEEFSISAELAGIFMYSIPSFVLIWYLLLKAKPLKEWGVFPGKNDLISGLITLPCLLITGFAAAFASSNISGTSSQLALHSPSTAAGWIILCVSCVSAAYLEESFFRFYILSRRDELKLAEAPALVISVALFSICHIYEGPWGFLNAIISGSVLAFIFLRYRALHGIAAAHGIYNIAVYAINAVIQN
ncbi:MAG: CPBP family intramembrane metalloprotease [Treponema sp.]|jgi:membrane protease YdiL (CAAX protease family)|nr:CPBP family intramembrane metalloprotease [Treponema sp.]